MSDDLSGDMLAPSWPNLVFEHVFSYHLLYFCTALSLIIMLSSHYHHHKSKTFSQLTQCPFTGTLLLLCPPPWGVDILFLLFSPSDVRCPMSGVRRPMSGVTHGFRSFKGKVLELLSPNLVCRLIGSVACLGLLLAVVPLLLTE